jgi:site-specific recombinase XerD
MSTIPPTCSSLNFCGLEGARSRKRAHAGCSIMRSLLTRHSFASTLFWQGIKINVVSKLLGHKDVATTYKIY